MSPSNHQDIRDAIRDLCSQFSAEYFRQVDDERAYPQAFVEALTKAGWLAALIPVEYGGSGLGMSIMSAVIEKLDGKFSLRKSELGGLAIVAQLPIA